MEGIELYEQIASELEEKLGHNHICTILHLEQPGVGEDPNQNKLPQFLIIVRKFDKYTLMIISNILREYPEQLKIPFVVEYDDMSGILDSIPKSLFDIKLNYRVLAGQDIMEMVKPPSYEHFRAQTELTLRNDILNLRQDLIRVMSQQMNSQEFLKELSIVALTGIKNYYQIVQPKLKTTEEIIIQFNEDFPDGKGVLQRLLNYTYSLLKGMDISEEDKLQLILLTIDNVLQPLLIEIDAIGIEFEKILAKESKKLSYEDFMEKYGEEINRLKDIMYSEITQNAQKREHVLRGELELKFRKRERELIERYESQIGSLMDEYDEQIEKFENNFDEELKKRTTEFINKKVTEDEDKLVKEYQDKMKKMRDELELKYITTDLRDQEEKLRREFNSYEKTLREGFSTREKALREDLDMKMNNYKESIQLDLKAKLDDQMDKLRKDFDEELDDAIERNKRKQQRQYDAELKRREKAIESNFKKDFNRKVKDTQRQFKHDLQLKENEIKSKLHLNFEKEKVRMETRKSEAFLKLIEQELGLKYREIEKYKIDMLKMDQLRETHTSVQEKAQKSIATRNFVTQPDADDTEEGTDLFSKIVKENRMLMSGLPKKKKVS